MLTLEDIQAQEEASVLDHFTAEDAWRLGCLVHGLAGEDADRISVSVKQNGRLLFFCAGNETTVENEDWIRWKRNTVERFCHSSYYMKKKFNDDFDLFYRDRIVSPESYTIYGGGFPIVVRGGGNDRKSGRLRALG